MKPLRRILADIKIIIIHCSDSDNDEDIAEITKWHQGRGFHTVGYHYYINKSGLQIGRPLDIVGAHCKGFNTESIGICLGGKTIFTVGQFKAAAKLIDSLYLAMPNIKAGGIFPHRMFDANKTCPNFDIDKITQFLACQKQLD